MINYEAFDKKISQKQLFKKLKENFSLNPGNNTVASTLISIGSVVFIGFIWLYVLILVFVALANISNGFQGMVPVLFQLCFLFFAVGIVWAAIAKSVTGRLRLEAFCKDNNFDFLPQLALGKQTGALFQKGDSRKAKNGIRGNYAGGFILFDYQYSTGSGKNRSTHHFGVARLPLLRKFPHILLDNKRDGSIGSFEFGRDQRLELEGNFNKFFNVYGPKEYEIEVLQVLNPAVMQALLDMPEPVDIEIIGRDLYIYNKGNHYKKRDYAVTVYSNR